MGARLEKAIREAIYLSRPTRDVIAEAAGSADFSLFMQKVRESVHHRRVLCLHRTDLFGPQATRIQALFYLSNLRAPKGRIHVTTAGPSKALEHAVASEVMSPDRAKDFFSGFLGLGPQETKEIGSAIADVVAFFGLMLVRTNESLRSLVNSEDFSYSLMKERLGDYKATISTKVIGDYLNNLFSGTSSTDPALAMRIESVLVPLIAKFARTGLPDLGKLSKMIPDLLLTLHLESQSVVTNLLEASGVNFEDYLDILEDAHLFHLIRSYNTIHWCENCSLETPLIESSTGRIAPSKLARKHCMNCAGPMSYSAVYTPDELVKDALLCKDGFLAVLLGWCLHRDGVEFTCGEYAGAQEMDFVILRPGLSTIVEVKTFKSEKDDAAVKSELKNSLVQLDHQVRAMHSKGAKVDRAFILWNREEDLSREDEVVEFERSHPGIQVRLFSYLNVDDAIHEATRP